MARGVCTVNADGHLADIHERTRIEKHGDQAEYTEMTAQPGSSWGGYACIDEPWGFTSSILKELKARLFILEKICR